MKVSVFSAHKIQNENPCIGICLIISKNL